MFCTNCGKEIKDGSTICAYCGAKVEKEVKDATEQFEEKKVVLKPEIVAASSVQKDWTDIKTDTEKIKQATESLTQVFYSISEKLYSQKAAENGANGASDGTTETTAEETTVEEDDK